MNKTQLVDAIATKANITKVDAKRSVDAFIQIVGDTLGKGDKISIMGFGSFSVSRKTARTGRNFRTGAAIRIAPKNVVRFNPGIELNARIM